MSEENDSDCRKRWEKEFHLDFSPKVPYSLYERKENVMNTFEYIEADPERCHGQAVFKDTRIMVYLVLELLEVGVPVDEILTRYYPQLTLQHVQAALHFAAELIKSGEWVPFVKA